MTTVNSSEIVEDLGEREVFDFTDRIDRPLTPLDEKYDSDEYTDTDSEFEEYEQCDCVDDERTTTHAHEDEAKIKNKIPYMAVYDKDPEEHGRQFFIPSKPIKATIVSAHRDSGINVHMFNPYLYTIKLEHDTFVWTVERRYDDFQSLHNHLVLYRAAQKLASPMKRLRHRHRRTGEPEVATLSYNPGEGLSGHRISESSPLKKREEEEEIPETGGEIVVSPSVEVLKRRSWQPVDKAHAPIVAFEAPVGNVISPRSESSGGGDADRSRRKRAHKIPKFPFVPDSLIGAENIEARRDDLQRYLDGVLHIPKLRNHKETAEFLDVSYLSFVHNLGLKRKEGLVKKRPGGRRDTVHVRMLCHQQCCKWSKRWLIVKDSFVAYVHPGTNIIREVMLFDNAFNVKTSGYEIEGVRHGVQICNFTRDLVVKAESDREAEIWKQNIDEALNGKGEVWKRTNQFGSFFPVREHSYAQWFVDGKSMMEHAASMMELAVEEIFITDWFLTPELFLKRPPNKGSKFQLMEILNRKAKQGVKVFVMLYKEVEMVLGIGSGYAKRVLMAMDPNILVFRHPDTVPIPSMWAHHEKIIVIDQNIAFIGGIDLCYGRWDDFRHKLSDISEPPKSRPITLLTEFEHIAEALPSFGHVGSKAPSPPKDEPDTKPIQSETRMIFTETPPLIVKALQEKSPTSPTSPTSPSSKWKAVQANVVKQDLDEEPKPSGWDQLRATVGGDQPKRPDFAEIVRKYQEYVDSGKMKEKKLKENTPPMQRKKTKLKKAIDNWKQKMHKDNEYEDEIYKEYERMISFEELESQLDSADGISKLWIGKDYVNFIVKDVVDLEHAYCDFVDRSAVPRLPWHDISSVVYGAAARDAGRHFVQRWNQIKTHKFKYDETYPYLVPKSYDNVQVPNVFRRISNRCTAQVLRSGSEWSCGIHCINESIHQAYIHMITNAEHFVYIENQFFISMIGSSDVLNLICKTLFERIVKAHRLKQKFRVFVFLPLLPAFEGELGTPTGLNMQTVLYWTYNSICKGPNSLIAHLEKELGEEYHQYLHFFSLRTHNELCGSLVSELIYIHSKLIIVDDKFTLIGSANINDRSQLGDRDSEMALFVEDVESVESKMNGVPCKVGKFSNSIRRQLFGEHLGLLNEFGKLDEKLQFDISDPISDEMFDFIKNTAKSNTEIYEKVFKCYPTDLTKNYVDLAKYKKEFDTCMARTNPREAKTHLASVQGYVVDFPLKFLTEENLSPPLLTKEGLAPVSLYV